MPSLPKTIADGCTCGRSLHYSERTFDAIEPLRQYTGVPYRATEADLPVLALEYACGGEPTEPARKMGDTRTSCGRVAKLLLSGDRKRVLSPIPDVFKAARKGKNP